MDERHRHRYEVNPTMIGQLEAAGLRFVGKDESGQRMEIVELKGHPFFVASQFHPEFKSRPGKAAPLFLGLILAAAGARARPCRASNWCCLICMRSRCSTYRGSLLQVLQSECRTHSNAAGAQNPPMRTCRGANVLGHAMGSCMLG